MKSLKIAILVTVGSLAGCASTPNDHKGEIPTISSQAFKIGKSESIKIDKTCGWLWNNNKCSIDSIEAVGVMSSVGATRLAQKAITDVACDNARANVVEYVYGTQLGISRNTKTKNKQSENQKDRTKSKTELGQDVDMASDDADKDTNYSIRESLANSDIDVVKSITTNSQGRLIGFAVKDTVVIDSKTLACTIRWSKSDAEDMKQIRRLISGS